MSDRRRLVSFYDAESHARAGRPIDPARIVQRSAFCQMLAAEGRTRVIDVGSGPGRDAVVLSSLGFGVTCVDLSPTSVDLCRVRGLAATAASATELPFADQAFDAGWTMSTLTHLDDGDLEQSLAELRRVLVRGAPLAIGTWAADPHRRSFSRVDDPDLEIERSFYFRTQEQLASILTRHAKLEDYRTWAPVTDPGRTYQWWLLRFDQS